jgi:hypothetical protein
MKTVNQIFNYIAGMNPTTSTVSSLGTYTSELHQQVADSIVSEVVSSLPEESLAYKIASSVTPTFSDKQLWVIAFELEKNVEFTSKVATFYNEINRKSNAKAEASKAKLNANKDASADILAPIKEMKKIGDFGKWLNTSGNPFRKQHFNKSYTIEAVNAFLSTL